MNILIKNWLDASENTMRAIKEEEGALDKAEAAELPHNLIPAKASDIIKGNIIWYPRWQEGFRLWEIVSEVHCPSSPSKAFTGHSGCRYGLEGAFVEDDCDA